MPSIVLLLAACVSLAALACSDDDGSELRDAPIESAEVVSVDTAPPSYELHVVSQIPGSSCHEPQEAELERDGTEFRVTVQNLFNGDEVCTADLGFKEHTLELPGPFDAGVEYTVLINEEPAITFVAE